jgi:hypothetical protein
LFFTIEITFVEIPVIEEPQSESKIEIYSDILITDEISETYDLFKSEFFQQNPETKDLLDGIWSPTELSEDDTKLYL